MFESSSKQTKECNFGNKVTQVDGMKRVVT